MFILKDFPHLVERNNLSNISSYNSILLRFMETQVLGDKTKPNQTKRSQSKTTGFYAFCFDSFILYFKGE